MIQFFVRRWFLLLLATVLLGGWWGAELLEPLARAKALRSAIVGGVLFIMALPLEARTIGRSLRSPLPPLLGVLVNFGVVPLLAAAISPLLARPMALGLFVAAATPCTLASASVWTRRAGGNDASSLLVTILTNASCFVATPLLLAALTGQRLAGRSLDARRLIGELALLVVLPMVLAQLLRLNPLVGRWATARKIPLAVLAQMGVLAMVFLGSIQMGLTLARAAEHGSHMQTIPPMIAAVLAVHVAALMIGLRGSRLLGLPRSEQIAVAFAGSQKTLMVGLQVAMELGITILPMIAYHVGQLLVDTLIADRLQQQGKVAEPTSSKSAATGQPIHQRGSAGQRDGQRDDSP